MPAGSPSPVVEARFTCMGTDAHVMVTGRDVDGLAEWARARLEHLERCWSRFLPDSELSLASSSPGVWQPVSAETAGLVRRALLARTATGGRYDPTLLVAVRAAGYTASLVPIEVAPGATGPAGTTDPIRATATAGHVGDAPRHLEDLADVELDEAGRRLRVGSGGFDPGGIAKGFAADLVVGELLTAGADGVCVNVGGDLRAAGSAPERSNGDRASWIVEVEDPRDPAGPCITRLSIADGAVATSSRCRRRWRRDDGTETHHLIDPSTGAPATGQVLAATVVAAEGWIAEALATAAFLAGPGEAAAAVGAHGATGLLVTVDGVVELPGLHAFTGS